MDDDPDFANILKIRLSKEKNPVLDITICHNLETALQSVRGNPCDLVLLDLMLPDSSGIETFTKMKAEARHIPVVIMTGLDNDQIAINAVRRGAEDYLVKSDISSKLLMRIIHHAIDRHRIKEKLASVTGRLRKTNLRLEKMALLDPLTELFNRRGLQQAFSREIQLGSREGYKPLVLLLDIDNFKQINDTLGHPVGDILLKEVAKEWESSVFRPYRKDRRRRIHPDPSEDQSSGRYPSGRAYPDRRVNTIIYVGKTETIRITTSIGLTPFTARFLDRRTARDRGSPAPAEQTEG